MKKYLAILGAAVLGFSGVSAAMPASFAVYAEEEIAPTSGTCGANLTWSYDTDSATLTFSGTGDMDDMTNFEASLVGVSTAPWRAFSEEMTTIVLEEGVTSIGSYAFKGMGGEQYQHINKVVTPSTLEFVASDAFAWASYPTEEQMKEPLVMIGNVVYKANVTGDSVVIPEGVVGISDCVFADTELKDITLPKSLRRVGANAFAGTPWLEAKQKENPLVIENGILIDGTTCEGDVVIPEGVTSIADSAFWSYEIATNDKKITSITVPEGVTRIGEAAFSNLEALKEVKLPESLKVIGSSAFQMFWAENSALESSTIPAGVEELGDWALNMCQNLKEVTILNPDCKIGYLAINNSNHRKSEDYESPDYEEYIPDYAGVIRGYNDSTAEAYAKEWGFTFESLGEAPAAPQLEPTLRGDVDESDEVDVSDAVLLARYLVEDSSAQITDQGLANADADASGKVNSEDVIRIVKMIAKLV